MEYIGGHTIQEAETFTAYLQRLGWVAVDDELVEITALGSAVLRASEQQQRDVGTESLEVIIDPDNPFAYATVWSALAAQGPGLLVDPYLRLEQLADLHAFGAATRLLISPTAFAGPNGRAVYERALTAFDGKLSVRLSRDLHDRYYLTDNGPVLMLGVSLNGIGRKISVLTTLSAVAGDAIRSLVERQWGSAELVEASASAPTLDAVPASDQIPDLITDLDA